MHKGGKDYPRAENEKKNSWKLMKRLWVCFLFFGVGFLAWQLSPLFSGIYKRIQKSAYRILSVCIYSAKILIPQFSVPHTPRESALVTIV